MTLAHILAGIAVFAAALFVALMTVSAMRLGRELLDQRRQQQPDEHSQWLGADAGGAVDFSHLDLRQ
ncbi:hypothetical protein [Sphingomonas turrisvirgatae]|uniref:Uncharacterized protein n=1 Tax=Sphingomonas turrisvirgatae TaxID=1888892 RepID=A0A1E3LZN5_9SPHN|nr:hypothetical protein [Sphingomonas turrisvirgatae]ODP39277.1 hypothetical protein BFL28_10715 [Sphingomonas turrisvirgatae]